MIEHLLHAANLFNVSPALLIALCSVESDLRPNVINHDDGGSASYGMCQIKIRTARHINGPTYVTDLLNPEINAQVAAKYLRYQLVRYDGDVSCALAAYNAGSCRFNKEGKIINANYVKKVKRRYKKYKAQYGDHQRPIYAPIGSHSYAVFSRRSESDQASDVIQSASSLYGRAGSAAELLSGDRRR